MENKISNTKYGAQYREKDSGWRNTQIVIMMMQKRGICWPAGPSRHITTQKAPQRRQAELRNVAWSCLLLSSNFRFKYLYLNCGHHWQPDVGRDSSVGTATNYGLDGQGIEFRWESRFSAPVHTDPGAHPASCAMGTGSFPGVKLPGRGVYHPPLSPRLRKE